MDKLPSKFSRVISGRMKWADLTCWSRARAFDAPVSVAFQWSPSRCAANSVDTLMRWIPYFFCFDVLIWNYIAYRLPADAPADGVPVSFQSKREGPKPSDEQQMQIVSEVKLTQFMPANTTVDLGNIMYQYISNYLIKQLAVKYGKIVSWVIICDWCRITPSHCVRSLMWPGHGSWTVVAFHLWHI